MLGPNALMDSLITLMFVVSGFFWAALFIGFLTGEFALEEGFSVVLAAIVLSIFTAVLIVREARRRR